jgi:hypothetical protein
MTENITLGATYKEKYLDTELGTLGLPNVGRVTLNRVKKPYGWLITEGTNYISIYKIRLELFPDGRAKATVKVDKNYHSPYQYTLYFDKQGREIKDKHNRTRAELAYWKNC